MLLFFSKYILISLPFLLKKMRWKSESENGSSRALGWLASKTEFGTSTARRRKSNLPIRFLVVPLEASFIVFNEGINKPIIFLPTLFFSNMWTLTDQTIVLISLRSKFLNEYFAKCKMLQNDDKKECLALHYNLEAVEDYTSDKSKSLYVLSNFEMDTNCPYKDGEMPQMRSIL